MRLKQSISGFILLLALSAKVGALADGLVNGRGHVAGQHTDLTLTVAQKQELAKGQRKLRLTAEQRKQLQHLRKGTNVQEIYVFPSNTESCTCELANVAIQVGQSRIEVANRLFGRDLQAEIRELKADEEKKFAEEHTHRGSKELQLFDKANEIPFEDPGASIPLYEEALKINPHLTRARDQLCCAWNNLGVQKEKQGKLSEAIECFEKSKSYTDSKDDLQFANTNLLRVRNKLTAQGKR